MKRFLLAYLASPKYGGWPTFTAHLHRGLRATGWQPLIVKLGNRTEKHLRDFGRKMHYQNLSASDMKRLLLETPSLICAIDKHTRDYAADLISLKVPAVVHDPTELRGPMPETVQTGNIIVIRQAMLAHIPNATFVKHPYQPRTPRVTTRAGSVSVSRIDFDKHTDLIVKANQISARPIIIYGACNTMYAHHKLKPIDPAWDRNYRGQFDGLDLWGAARIAAEHERVVDMSAIKGDGGGTQYTFLEAIDAGAELILNADWQPSGVLAEYARTVSTHEELAAACEQPPTVNMKAADELLRQHDAAMIANEIVTKLNIAT